MTPKQKRVYYFIRSTINSSGICPTYDEIMGALNIKSKSVVANYLNHLEKEGKIKINRVKARGIEIEDEENSKLKKKIERLEKQLKIAVKALKNIIKEDMYNLDEHRVFVEGVLKRIKELEK